MVGKKPNVLLVICLVLALICGLTPFSPVMTREAYAKEDATAPVLNGFRIVNPTVERPGVVQIQLDVTEEDSGFSDFAISLEWRRGAASKSGNMSTGLEWGGASGDMCSNFDLSLNEGSKQFGEYSGTYTFDLYVGDRASVSEYTITGLWIADKEGNETGYSSSDLPALASDGVRSFKVTGDTSGDDFTAPVLNGFRIVNPTVERPGVVQIQLDVTEEDSGFSDFAISLEWRRGAASKSGNMSTGLEWGGASGDMCSNFDLSLNEGSKQFGECSGTYTFDLYVGDRASVSEYTITGLWIADKEGNETGYSSSDLPALASDGVRSFTVTGDASGDDFTAPVLNGFEILNPTVTRPGVLKLKIDITEQESGLSDIGLSLSWKTNGEQHSGSICTGLKAGGASGDMCSNFEFYSDNNSENFGGKTGSYIFTLLIGEKADLTTYSIENIWIADMFDNTTEVGTQFYSWEPNDIKDYSLNGITSFDLEDEFNYSFTTGTNNPNLADRLRSMPEGTAAKVEIMGDGTLSKECLDAVAGKDKTIVAYSNDVQWVIRGEELTGETKDLNLRVAVSTIRGGESFVDDEDSEESWAATEDFVRLDFYPNGELPGKLQVRFKSDALYNRGIRGSNPVLYYFDGENLIYENDDSDLNFDGTDKWCYVTLSHNSTFLVSNSSQMKLRKSGNSSASAQPMLRLYNPYSGEHFYTASQSEHDHLVSIGWNDEGVGWHAPKKSNTPVYRLYNAFGGEHHYTMSASERNNLISLGWNDEGIGWYSDDAKRTPLLREYNPYAFANNHNYTTSASEHNWLIGLGWRDEGMAWYGL